MIDVLNEVGAEFDRAKIFPPFHSPHEALGVILEEFDEFKDEVYRFNLFKNRDTRPAMRTELIQLAAMAVKGIAMIDSQLNPSRI